MVHKVRNALNHVRKKDQYEMAEALKPIYKAPTKNIAEQEFESFKLEWGKRYPKIVESWEANLPTLLTFMNYPLDIRYAIYTTNWIERTNKEFRKRIKPMDSFPNIVSAEKILYLISVGRNEAWLERVSAGYKRAKPKLQEMFEKRYGN